MCGVTGAVSLNKPMIDIQCAKPMADRIAHRGPDDAGYLFFHTGCRHNNKISFYQNLTDNQFKHLSELLPSFENQALQRELSQHHWDLYMGHRRLSILDTSPAGHQPMSDLSKNIWIVYNGEIYNFKEIREELKNKGHKFSTRTDTEVIIYAYIEWGIDCIHRFNGMFAFSLYDNFQKKLFLVRDRYGIKPLYFTVTKEQTLIFASEVKSILEYKDYYKEIDHEALLEYFTFQNIFTDKTLHKNIKLLPAGNYIEIDLAHHSNATIQYNQYWDFNFSEPKKVKDEREYIEELDRLFNQAIKRQLVADVDVGSYLSGGMDSGSISAVAAQTFPYLKTFTCGFDLNSASGLELSFDERVKAEAMSYLFKTEHYEMVLKSGDMERCLPKLVYHLEEPRVGQSYPNFYAAQLASKFVKVVLSGTGGDELFGGYPWRYYRAVVNDDFEHYIDKYYHYWQRLVNNTLLKQLFSPIWKEVEHVWTRDIFSDVFLKKEDEIHSPEDYINHSLYFESKTFLHGLFVVEDKLSMAHSLESRVPFMDNDLVDFAMQCPVHLKINNLSDVVRINENEFGDKKDKYFQKTSDGKQILRNVMSSHIPEDIVKAEKQGFSAPDATWFKGDSIDFVKRNLLDKNAAIYNYMDYKTASSLLNEHINGQNNRRLLIWSLLYVNEMFESNFI